MKKDGEPKKLLSGLTIYLLSLLAAVLLYYCLVYPGLNTKFVQLDAQYNTLQMQNAALARYEGHTEELQQETTQAWDAYHADTTLRQQTSLSNLVSQAADESGVVLMSVSIQNSAQASVGGFTGQVSQASIQVEIPAGGTPVSFLQKLESYGGAGFYVTQLSYQPVEEGYTPAVQTAEDGAAAAADTPGLLEATVSYYTVDQ